MKSKTKAEMAKQLNQILMVKNISWTKLPKRDIVKLYEAFIKLKEDVDKVFIMLVESSPKMPEAEKPCYCV